MQAYRKSDTLYWQDDCGCIVLMIADMPDVVKDSERDIARQALKGRVMKRAHRNEAGHVVDMPDAVCSAHQTVARPRTAAS